MALASPPGPAPIITTRFVWGMVLIITPVGARCAGNAINGGQCSASRPELRVSGGVGSCRWSAGARRSWKKQDEPVTRMLERISDPEHVVGRAGGSVKPGGEMQ